MNDSDSCKVSVVLPVYNTGSDLLEAIESVTTQQYGNIELILVDDGSTDGSGDLCDDAALKDTRILVVHKPNGGVSSARNAGLAKVTGDYVMFIDADDRLVPGAIKTVITRVTQTSAEMACFGMTFVYHDGEREVSRDVKSVGQIRVLDSREAIHRHFFELYEHNYWSPVWNKLYSARFLREHRVQFDTEMAILEDFEFVLQNLKALPRVVVMPEPLYDYHNDLTKSSLSRRPGIDYLRNFQILEVALREFGASAGLDSLAERGRLQAIAFRAYLMGIEMFFEQSMGVVERCRNVKTYSTDERVVGAARGATPQRRGVALMAWLVAHRWTFSLHAVLAARGRLQNTRRLARIIASRAKALQQGQERTAGVRG